MAPPLHYYSSNPNLLPLLGVALVTLYIVGTIFYRLFLHPLRKFPGPLLWRISHIPRTYHLMKGDLPFILAEFREKYGKTIRITPGELAFHDPQAWKDIYGHRTGGAPDMPKYYGNYHTLSHIPMSIIDAPREEHALLRRQLSHGFSEKSMREQGPIIQQYVDLLIQRIYENGKNGSVALNMREWFNWTTFDIIGDLGFGSSFDCLKESAYHPWVSLINNSIIETAAFRALINMGLRPLVDLASQLGLMTKNDEQTTLVRNKLQERMKLGYERPDLIEGLLKKDNEWNMGLEKLTSNANILIVAGSETTATLLSGATYLLAANPDKLAILTKEVRSTFSSEAEIDLMSVGKLRYMLACLDESFRMYPPVASDLSRMVPKGGAMIGGEHVAEGARVSTWQWSINRDPTLWKDPSKYVPERWLGDAAYKDDRLDAVQPFSYGPRNCIGRNLAYAEMRLIMAKILYNFDMTIREDSADWITGQKVYILWNKPPLNVYMTPVGTKSG
ncbi:cytochrome P450 [Jackrogersella minutella]|nr:cytochrome P450 [Jackrogersella minutella]